MLNRIFTAFAVIKDYKPHIYTALVTLSLLHGLYLDDQEIIICSFLLTPMCVIFIFGYKNKES